LQREKDGLTVDDIAGRLAVTRTAVRQHLAALERDGYVHRQVLRRSVGRPRHVYALTAAGDYLFPKQYHWFSALLLESLKQDMGQEGLIEWLRRLAGLSPPECAEAVVRIMNELGYDARLAGGSSEAVEIVATNCVYHELARAFPKVCHFDYALLEGLGAVQSVEHPECMVRGACLALPTLAALGAEGTGPSGLIDS
jgi:predicted ArsR family transcriptional regulator